MTQSRKSRRNNEVYRSLRKEERLHAKERQSRPAHQSEEGAPRIQDEAGTRAEEALRQTEQRFQAIFDNTSDGIFLLDLEARRFTLCNTSCLQMLGYTREELVRLSIADLHSPEDLPFIYAQMEEFLNGRKGTRRDIRFRRKDGSFLFVDLNPYLVRLDGKRYVVVTLKDITERKRMEEALAASEQKYRSLVENVPDVMWTTDRQGRTLFISPNVVSLYGYSAEEVCAGGDTWLGNVHPDDRARVEKAFDELFTQEKRYDVEYRIRRKDGTWIWLHDRSVSTYERGGQWYADGVFSEITVRKRLEEEIRRHAEHLEELVAARTGELGESEARYRSLYHTIADGIFVMGAEGRIEDVNDSACAQLGYTRAELVGLPVSAVSAGPDFNLGEIFDRLRATGSLSYETVHRRKDGGIVPVELSLALVEYRGRPAILGVARDITARKQAETALRESRQRLQAVVEGTSDAVYLKDLQGRYLLFNSAAGRFVGKSPDEVLGRDDTFLFPPDEARVLMEGDPRVMGGGKPVTYEEHVTTADGQRRTFSSTKGPILDADGKVVGLFGIARDITERKQAQDTLRESEERYRRLVDNLKGSHFIYTHDTTGMLTYVSESVTQVLGYALEEDLPHYGQYFTDHPANEAAHRHTELTLQGIRQPSYEVNVWHKDGSTRWLEVQEVPVYDADGKVVAVEGVAQDITERKRAQEALRESEDRYRILLESGFDGIFVHEDFRIVQLNDRLAEMTGYTRAELMGSKAVDLFTPESQERIRHYATSEATGYFEIELCRRDGQLVDLEAYGTSCRFQGRPARIVGLRDITERKRAQAALRESEEKFRLLAETSPVAILIYQDGHYVYANPAVESITGYTPTEFLPQAPEDIIHPDYRQQVKQMISRRAQGEGPPMHYELKVLTKNGQERWMDSTTVSIAYGNKPAGLVVAFDITERKRAEEALQESEEKFRLLAETSPAAIIIYQDGKFVYVNPAAESIAGYGLDEFVKMSPLDLIHPDFREMAENQVFLRLHAIERQSRYEVKILTKDGREKWMDNSSTLIEYKNKPASLVVALDITERKQAEEALRRWNEQLELQVAQRTEDLRHTVDRLRQLTLELSQAEDRERKRIAGILHEDVQQMLAAARFHLNLLGREIRSAEESREIIEQVRQMLRDAIERSRNLSHELSPAIYQVELTEILNWLARHMEQKHGLTVRLEVHGPVDSPSEPLKAFLYKVVQELLFNVVKHTGVPEARIRVRQMRRCLYLSVVDRGQGFDPQRLETTPGFGLLGIRERIGLLGGRMKIKSAPGAGSTLLIALPYEAAARAQNAVPPEYRDASDTA
jgi:PAS domain S-box-containing protein